MSSTSHHRWQHELRGRPSQTGTPLRVLVVRGNRKATRRQEDHDVLHTLRHLGHTVFDLDVDRHPLTLAGPAGAGALFSHEPVDRIFSRFSPGLVLMGGLGWGLTEATAERLRRDGVPVVSLTPVPGAHHATALDLAGAVTRAELLRDQPPPLDRILRALDSGHHGSAHRGPGGPAPCDQAELRAQLTSHRQWSEVPPELAARALAHLASNHLYEHRLEAMIGSLGLRAGAPRPRTVLFSGYYGAGNRGDELLLQVLLEHLEANVPGAHPVVAASRAPEVERLHGVQAFPRADLQASELHAATASSLVLGPGGHWHDYSIRQAGGAAGMVRAATVSPAHMAQLPLLVAAYGGTVHVHGMGVGPLDDIAARAAVRLTGRLARTVVVRDRESAEILEPLAEDWAAEVTISPDVVYGLALPASTPALAPTAAPDAAPAAGAGRRPRYLAVNLRPWTDADQDRRRLWQTLFEVARDHGLQVVGVPMQSTDEQSLQDFAAAAPAGVSVEILPADLGLEDFLTVLRGAEVLVAMRLHANLLMHRLRRPALGLAYDPKVRSHFLQLGRAEAVLDLDAPAPQLRATLERLLSERGLPEQTTEALDGLERRAAADLDRLSESLRDAPLRIPDPSWIQHPAPTPVSAATLSPQPAPAAGSEPVTAPERTPTPVPGTTPLPSPWKRQLRRVYRGLRRRLR
ncbi:polysaccharide pyruvyl transferase family protein [Microbacterium sp. A93]|uniref:polysaccharide pyruvyl transferase family protein n=1 Tax=Microbacterium sp. A93 TaxID=3450716 RepID=UPI003F444A5D